MTGFAMRGTNDGYSLPSIECQSCLLAHHVFQEKDVTIYVTRQGGNGKEGTGMYGLNG
ncbi:MAG: hypothetical protein H7Y39_03415 [Nitrospiraceae bacterium]|nr:hypothetical protein [Nitrospiraceae bacterium]